MVEKNSNEKAFGDKRGRILLPKKVFKGFLKELAGEELTRREERNCPVIRIGFQIPASARWSLLDDPVRILPLDR